jgi:hypothetical protein
MVKLFATTVQDLLKLRHNARSQTPLKQDWYLETEKASYENEIHLFRRGEMFYMQDSATGKQTSLRTKDETEAKSLLEARNAAQRQPPAKPAPCPRLPDGQRPRLCGTHMAGCHGADAITRQGDIARRFFGRFGDGCFVPAIGCEWVSHNFVLS